MNNSSLLSSLPDVREREIGFDWVCFLAAQKCEYFHNQLVYRHLRSFASTANWLCFFKRTLSYLPSDLSFGSYAFCLGFRT
jgi:hypothetical protein